MVYHETIKATQKQSTSPYEFSKPTSLKIKNYQKFDHLNSQQSSSTSIPTKLSIDGVSVSETKDGYYNYMGDEGWLDYNGNGGLLYPELYTTEDGPKTENPFLPTYCKYCYCKCFNQTKVVNYFTANDV